MIIQGKNIQYNVTKTLGEGTYGITYLAEGSDGMKYAIKKFKSVHGAKENRDFEESTLMAILSICQRFTTCFIESINDSQGTFIVMDFIDGSDMKDLIFGSFEKRMPLSERIERGQVLIKDLVFGLSQIHNLGLIHQDIKPENLMYTRDGNAKYIDFGLSCFITKAVNVGGIPVFGFNFDNSPCGTPGTISTSPPEMLLNKKPEHDNGIYTMEYLIAHDIWSIACVILDWYTIQDDDDRRFTAHSYSFYNTDYTPIFNGLEDTDEVAYTIVCGLMNRDPIQRIRNFNEIVQYYDSWFGDLINYPNLWNSYNVTDRVRRDIKELRCKIRSADRSLTFNEIGVTARECVAIKQTTHLINRAVDNLEEGEAPEDS